VEQSIDYSVMTRVDILMVSVTLSFTVTLLLRVKSRDVSWRVETALSVRTPRQFQSPGRWMNTDRWQTVRITLRMVPRSRHAVSIVVLIGFLACGLLVVSLSRVSHHSTTHAAVLVCSCPDI